MKPKLISYKLCPFVQRAAIVLEHKMIEHDIEYIDLASPPAWFVALSPLKKVPVLLVGDNVIFESMVINEYLDEAYPKQLHPQDILLRAKNRSWIEFGNECMWSAYHLSIKETEREFNEVRDELLDRLDHIEKVMIGVPFFNGDAFSLVDASYAPLLRLLEYLNELKPGTLDAVRHPKINTWKNNLLTLSTVRRSCVPEFKTLYHQQLWQRQGYISTFLDKTKHAAIVKKSIY